MSVFVHITSDDTFDGFYDDELHDAVPAGAVPITAADRMTWAMAGGDAYRPGAARPDGTRALASRTPSPPTVAQLTAYAVAAQAKVLAGGQTFNVAASGQPAVNILCDGTNDTRADLGLLALFGRDNPSGTKTWIDNDGVATVLTGAQLVTLATMAGNWIADTYPALASLVGQIAAETITTTAEIDAFAWPTS